MNNTTNTTQGVFPPPAIDVAERMFKIVFYVALFIVGTIGNLLVVFVIKGKRKRTVNDYFILNLAVADLTFLCFSLPFYYYELFEKFTKFQFYCRFVWPMMSVSLFIGIFTLVFMSVERCRAIVFPFRPRMKKPTLFTGIMAVWGLSVLCILPLMVVTNPQGVFCFEHWPSEVHRKAYTAALFILQFAIPILVIAIAYITIIIKLIKTKVPNRTSVNERGQLVKVKNRKENIHVIRTVAVIVILFVVCMLPNQMAWILFDFGGEKYKNLSEKFWLLAEALMFFHSCVNPVIYGTLTRQFREGYIKYINFICSCGRSVQVTVDLLSEQHKNLKQTSSGPVRTKLTHKGSLRSPSQVRNKARASTIVTSVRITSSPDKTSQPSLTQAGPVIFNSEILEGKALRGIDNVACLEAVEVHHSGFVLPRGIQNQPAAQTQHDLSLLPENDILSVSTRMKTLEFNLNNCSSSEEQMVQNTTSCSPNGPEAQSLPREMHVNRGMSQSQSIISVCENPLNGENIDVDNPAFEAGHSAVNYCIESDIQDTSL